MNFQFTNSLWLLVWPPAVAWVIWLTWKSDVQVSPWRRWIALSLRLVVVSLLVLAISGIQWLSPREGMNVYFLLDRSDSVPSAQQEASLKYVRQTVGAKEKNDKAGVVVFGADASIETSVNPRLDLQKINAVVASERTDIAAAIRLGTAAFPENGQKRLVLLSDGNENIGDAQAAVLAAKPLGVTLDALPLGITRRGDVSIQKLGIPNHIKKGQTFEVKIFTQADGPATGTMRLFRNNRPMGEQKVTLEAGKNLFSFPETLTEPGFYSYDVQLDVPNDPVPQNNRATGFTYVRGDPTVLLISADPAADGNLVAALRSARLEVKVSDLRGFPSTLAEMQAYDTIFLSNIAAGDLGRDMMLLLESAVRDFGVGLVCLGGDQSFAAGGYRGTPLERTLPIDMELNSKKVLPSGALVIVCHATEFPGGNDWARNIAFAALDALGPQDEMGVVLWDGTDRWLFPLAKVGDKKSMGRQIAGMMPGDMPNFQHVMEMAYEGLRKSTANLKHMVVFSDGDPGAPTQELVKSIIGDKITISTVMIGGHVRPDTMMWMADQGKGRFYDVTSPDQLPQIFVKEAAVILKSAIFEQPFKPQLAAATEPVRGIAVQEYPQLRGYVASTPKPRAEVPLLSDKGDPLLAHWQYGLGRAVAFTSDAKAKWAADWIQWGKYRQFWSQIAQWSLRRIENADFTTEVAVEKGEGVMSVEALDSQGNYRNFLNLQAVVDNPKGERKTIRLEQTSPGRYEAHFPTREVGAYLVNVMEIDKGQVRASQVLGANVNYSPEFDASAPNLGLLRRLAETGGGAVLSPSNPQQNPYFLHRQKTFQPVDLWEWLLKLVIILFPLDVGVRRIQIDRAEWNKATRTLRRWLFFWHGEPRPVEADESLAALLSRRSQVRARTPVAETVPNPELFRPQQPVTADTPILTGAPPSEPPTAAEPVQPTPGPPSTGPSTKEAIETAEAMSTTSRLLEAKRRAQRRTGGGPPKPD